MLEEPPPLSGPDEGVAGRLRRLLRAVGGALARGGGIDPVLQECCQALVDHLGAAFARTWILEPGEATLRLCASAGIYTRLDGTFSRVAVGALKIGQIAADQQAHLTNDVANDPRIIDHDWASREGMVAFAGIPLVVDNEVLGVMALFARHSLEPEVLSELRSVADTMAQFVGRELAARSERARLARELHDTVSQGLYGISLAAQSGRRAVETAGSAADLRRTFNEIIELTDGAQAELRALIVGARPDAIDREGLVSALRHLVSAFSARYRIPAPAHLETEPRVDAATKQALYRIAQEALANVGRHSRAGTAEVTLREPAPSFYELIIADDGVGFEAADRPGHLGLRTMRERAAAVRGSLEITSAPGQGTRLKVTLQGPEHSV